MGSEVIGGRDVGSRRGVLGLYVLNKQVAGGENEARTIQIAKGNGFHVQLLKICHLSEFKQLKGSPYFTRSPTDITAPHTVEKTLPVFLCSHPFTARFSSLHHVLSPRLFFCPS